MSWLQSDLHRVGGGFSVRFSLEGRNLLGAEWTPRTPTRRQMLRILPRYRAARNAFLQAAAERLGGGSAVVVELSVDV